MTDTTSTPGTDGHSGPPKAGPGGGAPGAAGGAGPSPAPPPKSPTEPVGWSGAFVPAEHDARSPGGFTTERDLLNGYLRDHRLTLEMKCAGLGPDDLARRSVPPSNLSLLGLLRHMASVEHFWFRQALMGNDLPRLYRTPKDHDADFNGAVADPAVVTEAWESWRIEVAHAERFMAKSPSLDSTARRHYPQLQLREILVHMIEEYARHCGHADFLRERIDGRAGL